MNNWVACSPVKHSKYSCNHACHMYFDVFWAYHDKFKDFPSLLGLPSLFDLKSKVGSSGTLGRSGGAGIGARGLQ